MIGTLVKGIGTVVISVGTSAIAKNMIKSTTPEDTKKLMKFCIFAGGHFVGGMCGLAASKKFEKTVGRCENAIREFMKDDENEEMSIEQINEVLEEVQNTEEA